MAMAAALSLLLFISPLLFQARADESSPIISRFQQYLKINTAHPFPNYSEAAQFILSEAESLSLPSQILELVPGKPLLLLKWAGTNPSLPSVLLNSHTDVVPAEPLKWAHPPFSAHIDPHGNIYARGSQYLEAIRKLKASGFEPTRTVYLSFVPDEEIGGVDGVGLFVESETFTEMNVGIVLDEGLPCPDEHYRVFYGEKSPWGLVIKATGQPGHGAKLYDSSAMENLMESIEAIGRFRASQFDMIKSGLKDEGEVVSVNMAFLKAGTPTPSGFVMNLQPSEAEAGFDVRVPPTADPVALEKRITEEWALASRNMTFQFKHKVSVHDKFGRPILTATDSTNPWWNLLEEAVIKAGGKIGRPQIFPASTDSHYYRQLGLPAIGFSPIANTPSLLHDHNEYLSIAEYLKGVDMYKSIIKAYASYAGQPERHGAFKDEL